MGCGQGDVLIDRCWGYYGKGINVIETNTYRHPSRTPPQSENHRSRKPCSQEVIHYIQGAGITLQNAIQCAEGRSIMAIDYRIS